MRKKPSLEPARFHSAVTQERTESQRALAAILSLVAEGDNAAFEDLYRVTSTKLYSLIARIVGNEPAAEEVLQDVYLTVWTKAKLYDGAVASPMTWLIAVARNKAIDRLRRDGLSREAELERVAAVLRDPAPIAVDELAQKQQVSRLTACLDQLDPRQREVIRAAFFGGFTYEELAKQASVPLPTMKSWIRRGLLRLKDCLQS